jgi:hypothetical protein
VDIKQFAEKYRLRLKKDDCGDWKVIGRQESHVYDGFADGKLGLYLACVSSKKFSNARRALTAVGCESKQAAGSVQRGGQYPEDGCLKFDPNDEQQAQAVINLAALKVRRVVSEETRERLRKRLIQIQSPEERALAA